MLTFLKNLFSSNKLYNEDIKTHAEAPYLPHIRKKVSTDNFDYQLFIQSLRETATWLEYVTPNNGSRLYRSAEIQPAELLQEVVRAEVNNYYERQKEIVNDVVAGRATILHEKQIPLLELDDVLHKGYLLYAYVNNSVTDGASMAESDCFFDEYDTPAWDTWTYWYESGTNEILIAWIPNKLVHHVSNGVDVNCVDCIRWAAPSSEKLTALLFRNNLIRTPVTDSTIPSKEIEFPEYDINNKLLEEINERVRKSKTDNKN